MKGLKKIINMFPSQLVRYQHSFVTLCLTWHLKVKVFSKCMNRKPTVVAHTHWSIGGFEMSVKLTGQTLVKLLNACGLLI